MAMSKLYTTDGKVRWFANEEDVNTKLISILGEKGMVEIGGFAANKILHWSFKGKNNDLIKSKFFQNPKNVYGFGHLEFYKKVI